MIKGIHNFGPSECVIYANIVGRKTLLFQRKSEGIKSTQSQTSDIAKKSAIPQ